MISKLHQLFDKTPKKRCGRCQARKPLDQFHRDRTRQDGRQHKCKSCVAYYQKLRQAKQYIAAEQERLRARKWVKIKVQS